MLKSKPSKSTPAPKVACGPCEAPAKPMTDRNLMATNPMREQFEPTTAEPVRQRARMAGV